MIADDVLDLACDERPYRHRFLLSDGRALDVLSYRADTSRIRAQVVDWARSTAKKAGAGKEQLDALKIDGSTSVEEPGPELDRLDFTEGT